MPKGYHIPQCSENDRLLIEEWAKSRTMESRLVERAKIIRRCLGGEPVKKIVRGFKSTYIRHGTLNLFAALEVVTGAIHTETTKLKRRVELLEFMDKVTA